MKMEVLGIKFAPLNIPLSRRIQTLAVIIMLWLPSIVINVAILLFVVMFCSVFWFVPLIYLIWIWFIDKNTPERGGRRFEWVANLKLYEYTRDYYPLKLKLEPDLKLDPNKNYLFCSFPHGVISKGVFSIITNSNGFNKVFPHHTRNFITLPVNFKLPIYRDYLMALGGCSSSARSINYILGYKGGGRICVLVVGGAEEVFYARPGPYHLVLKNRKGFIKLALKNGSPLVPVFSFGENDLFRQVSNPKGSRLRRIQEWIKAKSGVAPIIIYGRGILQYSFGFLPLRKPINVVVGKPIEFEKNENPTDGEVNALHARFVSELTELFEKYKYQYLDKPEEQSLIIL